MLSGLQLRQELPHGLSKLRFVGALLKVRHQLWAHCCNRSIGRQAICGKAAKCGEFHIT